MKKFLLMFVALCTLMCLPQTAKADDVYLLTAETINGQTGNWNPNDGVEAHKFSQVGTSTEYTLKVTQMPTDAFYFRIGVKGWGNQMQPYTNNDVLSLTGDKYNLITTEGKVDPFFGSDNAWKVTGYSDYDYLEIHVDIVDKGTKQVWVIGKKNGSGTDNTFSLSQDGAADVTNTNGQFYIDRTNSSESTACTFKINGTPYRLSSDKTVSSVGTTSYTATATGAGKLTLAGGLSYTITVTADGKVTVVAAKKQTSTAQPGYYLVGNFFSPANLGGDINPGGDDVNNINYNRLYFRFDKTTDNTDTGNGLTNNDIPTVTYSFDIPAAMTANMQILHVGEDGSETVYGPGSEYKLKGTCPKTGGELTYKLTGSATLAMGTNYWSLYTRNDGTTDDDGMYTVKFTVENGVPTTWTITHNPLKMVNYMLSTANGATAQPIYDTRKNTSSLYTQNIKAALHFDGKNSYYVVGYLVYSLGDGSIMSAAKEAYGQSGSTAEELHENTKFKNSTGTQNKLFFFGNGGYEFSTNNNHNKMLVNQKPFTLNISGTKVVEFNPNQGNTSLAQQTANCYGMNAEVKIPNPTVVDYPNKIALVGTAIPGTTNADGSWNWASTAADMTYDESERCYYVTIETTDKNQHEAFRFVGDRTQQKNWHEDTETEEAKMAGCSHKNQTGHKCTVDDPNFINYTYNGTTDYTNAERNIMWNRPAGAHTVKFYIVPDENGNATFKYTITSNEDRKYHFTLLTKKFVRTFSSHQPMDIVNKKVKAYVAYKYEKPDEDEISKEYSCGKLYLRQIDYIPADMGVMLVGETSTDGNDGDVINYSLRQRTDEVASDYTQLWTRKADYTGQGWNNYFVPTVEAVPQLGNADATHEHLYFGLSTFHKTQYYQDNQGTDIPDYLGFFRLKTVSRSGANKAYLSLPTKATVDNGAGATYGYCDYNGQFIGGITDDMVDGQPAKQARMMMIFDDDPIWGGTTGIETTVSTERDNSDNAYYTLQGMRVQNPTKGLYIHKGKKIIIK